MGVTLGKKNLGDKSNWFEQLDRIKDSTTRNYFSVLPDEESLTGHFSEGFVINKPKGRVGGDGYWLHKHDESVYIALFTCIGDGHLASMMIRIYMSALKKMVDSYSIDFPGSILQFLHQEVLARFRNKNNILLNTNANVGIVKLNTKSKAMDFAGANMNLLQITNREVRIVEGDAHQVGESKESGLSYSSISLKNADQSNFYLTSSGIFNLIGGPQYKKIGPKQLGDFFFKNKEFKMSQQKIITEDYLTDWTGVNQQNDDIMIIGFRA
ncbi:MAG: hypothetical protein AAF789_04995 [Bacteroidota bacterium]